MNDTEKALKIASILTDHIKLLDVAQMNLAEHAEQLGGELEGASKDINDARVALMQRRLHTLKGMVNAEADKLRS